MSDIHVEKSERIATIEIRRPPLNFFNVTLIGEIADALDDIDADASVRAVVLAAQGKAFCAGAEFAAGSSGEPASGVGEFGHLYGEALRIFRNKKPIVAAVHGAAIGGGLGLAMAADFRVTCPEARFSANFTKLGLHPGFGLTVTLPDAIGKTEAALMFYTSRRVTGEQAVRIGLASVLAPQDQVRAEARKLAAEIAECSPLGVVSTRATFRFGLADRVQAATDRELAEQTWLRATDDFREGVQATQERRAPNYQGR
jgi:enoyl-CoA hydratase/carnithine racemase